MKFAWLFATAMIGMHVVHADPVASIVHGGDYQLVAPWGSVRVSVPGPVLD